MHHIELPVRSTFKAEDSWYIVKKGITEGSCEGCDVVARYCDVVGHFCYDSPPALCSSKARSDGEDVIFVRLDDNV